MDRENLDSSGPNLYSPNMRVQHLHSPDLNGKKNLDFQICTVQDFKIPDLYHPNFYRYP